jgi:8-oxo-dGTP diphosphatase
MKLGTLAYLEKDGKILMMHRNKREIDIHKGKWNGLGGKMEAGESPEECIIREVEEESGYRIRKLDFAGILTFPLFGGDYWIVFVYTSEDFAGELKGCNEGDLEWVDKEKVKDLNLWDGDRIFLEWVFAKKRFSAKFEYEADKLLKHHVFFH